MQPSISIHAAREGGDLQALPSLAFCADISIHAAREGGDVLLLLPVQPGRNFNPRRP